MRYLTVVEVLLVHRRLIEQSGGSPGLRDRGALEAALALPRQTFAGQALYPTLIDQAAALGFALIANHPFVDGNKRVGHAAMEIFLLLNGSELIAPADEQEETILRVASGSMGREALATWLATHIQDRHA